jgi:glycerol-3-phosphate dehydrogenase
MGIGPIGLDIVIFGGGAAGLWLLDEVRRRGGQALLLEVDALGSGQTVASQGIIHGGMKYALRGVLTASARAISDMPLRWRRCLSGEQEPDLSSVGRRAEFCHLWQTRSIASRVAMLGARHGLAVRPTIVPLAARPAGLRDVTGTVARLDEQVIEPESLLNVLARRNADAIARIDARSGLELETRGPGAVELIRLINPETGEPLDVRPRVVVLTAGAGNEALRARVGLSPGACQRRPLHMVLARGPLPILNGHCVDGMRTRATITTTRDYEGRTIWQIGGQIAEDGVAAARPELVRRAAREIDEILPGVELGDVMWSTYRADRAEPATRGGRPADLAVLREGNVVTAWPTKLALVPRLADRVVALLDGSASAGELPPAILVGWPRPLVAAPPWEEDRPWTTVD